MPLPGYTRLKGTAEKFRTPSGEIISRRQYENIRARMSGWTSWSEYQRVRKTDDYKRWEGKYSRDRGKSRRQVGGMHGEYTKLYTPVRRARAMARTDKQKMRVETDPNGPLNDMLVALGLRPPDAGYDIGDTP